MRIRLKVKTKRAFAPIREIRIEEVCGHTLIGMKSGRHEVATSIPGPPAAYMESERYTMRLVERMLRLYRGLSEKEADQ